MTAETTYYEMLMKRAIYSRNSKSRDLVMETYGAAKAAYDLKAITWPQFSELNRILIVEGINNLKESGLYR